MRDNAELRSGFEGWLRERSPELGDFEIDLSRPKAGLSSETLFLDVRARREESEARESLVIRVPPVESALFPDYSLDRLARTHNALAATDVPLPAPVTLVEDLRWIGSPFLVMPRVAGRVLPTRPPYPAAGWLRDASALERDHLFTSLLESLARIHRVDWQRLDLGPLSGGGPDLRDVVEWWREYLDWAADGREVPPEYAGALDWCEKHVPDSPPTSLLWGDAQIVNAVFDDDFGVAAILDWEMASYGPAEIDLAWFLGLHELTVSTVTDTEPATFPGRDESIERYGELLGRPVADLRWYDVLAQVRSGAIVCRIGFQIDPLANWLGTAPQVATLRRMLDADA